MSWDIVLFNSKQKIKSVADIDENKLTPIQFSEVLEKSFENIKKDKNHREIIGSDFSIEFFSNKEYSSNIMIQLYGENGLYEIIELAKEHYWQIYDCSSDEMIDLKNPERNGFENHKKYVAKILKGE